VRKYEALFILAETVREDQVDAFNERIRGEIEKLGGTIQTIEPLGRRTFEIPLKKRESGVYVRFEFSLDPARMAAFQERLKMNEDIFRVQIVKVEQPAGAGSGG